jgi:hypothetical protein
MKVSACGWPERVQTAGKSDKRNKIEEKGGGKS